MANLYKRNGVYYVAYLHDGKRVYKSTGSQTKPEALRFLVDLQKYLTTKKQVILSACIQEFLSFSEKNHAANTHTSNGRVSKLFLDMLGDRHIHLVKAIDIERFKNKRLKTVSPVSVNIELRTLKAMFGYAVKWELLDHNPCNKISHVRIPDQLAAYLTQEQIRKLRTDGPRAGALGSAPRCRAVR